MEASAKRLALFATTTRLLDLDVIRLRSGDPSRSGNGGEIGSKVRISAWPVGRNAEFNLT